MAALTATKIRTVKDPTFAIDRPMTVDTGETLYKGAIVTSNAGYAEAAVTTNQCVGISSQTYLTGQPCILEFNQVELLTMSSPTVADIGKTVYAVDSGSVTTVSTSNSAIVGQIVYLGDSASSLSPQANTVYVHVTCRA